MLKKKMITNLFLISITIICFSNSVFAFEQKIFRNEINLDGEVSYAAKICKDSALVNVYKGNPYEEELTRIDLNTLTTNVLYKVYPLSNVFDCDPDTGNYFFIDPAHKDGEATILAYASGQPEQFLWKNTLNSTDYHSIEDIVAARNENLVLILARDLFALDKTTGKLIWKLPISGFSKITHVSVFQDTFYLTDDAGNRQAYDINHATLKWKFTEKYEYCSPPQIETLTKTLITACRTSFLNIFEIIGIDSSTGIVKWKLPLISPGLIEKSTTLFGNFVYSSSSTGTDATVNWMQMQTDGNPVQLYQWIGHYDEKRGHAHNILSSKEATAVSFHTGGRGPDNSNIYFFDMQGIKRDVMTFSNQGEAFLANTIWDNSFVYTTRGGIFGIYRMKKFLS